MSYEKFLSKVKYHIQDIFGGGGVDVINVRFYEDDRYFEFYVNEFEEEFPYFSKPSWEDSEYQIIEVVPDKKYSLVIWGKVVHTYTEGTKDGVRRLLEDLLIFREAEDHSNEVSGGAIFSGAKRTKSEQDAYSINMKDFQKIYEEDGFEAIGINKKYNLSNRAIKAFVEGERPYQEMDENWLREIGWKGTLDEALSLIESIESVDSEAEKWRSSWHHMRLEFGGDMEEVNFYNKYSLRELTNVYEEEKNGISNLEDALDFGAEWLGWDVRSFYQDEHTVIVDERIRFKIEPAENDGFYDVRYLDKSEGKKPYPVVNHGNNEDVLNWILDFLG